MRSGYVVVHLFVPPISKKRSVAFALYVTMRSPPRAKRGWGSRKGMIRALGYGAVVLSAVWAGYCSYSYDAAAEANS